MTTVIEQNQFMPIGVTCGTQLIYIRQGEGCVVLEREFAPLFAKAIEARRAATTKIDAVEDESAVGDSRFAQKDNA